MYEDLKSILINISDLLLGFNFKNNFNEELHEEIRELVIRINNLKWDKENYDEHHCDSNNCNIVEVFTNCMTYMLELLEKNEIENAKKIIYGFLEEK